MKKTKKITVGQVDFLTSYRSVRKEIVKPGYSFKSKKIYSRKKKHGLYE